jgi:hypothetical protein
MKIGPLVKISEPKKGPGPNEFEKILEGKATCVYDDNSCWKTAGVNYLSLVYGQTLEDSTSLSLGSATPRIT